MAKLAFDPEKLSLGLPVREMPRYTASDAGGYLGIPATTIRSWFFGTTYGKVGQTVAFDPVLKPASLSAKLLSFDNLVEAYVLRQFRHRDNINLRHIARAIEYARDELGIEKPLLEDNLIRVGKSIFLEKAGEFVGLSDPGQLLLPHAGKLFERIEYVDDAIAAIFPGTRDDIEDSPRIISISPSFSFGKAVVDRTKVPTDVIRDRYMNGDTIDDLVDDYECERSEIEEAIRAEWKFAFGHRKSA